MPTRCFSYSSRMAASQRLQSAVSVTKLSPGARPCLGAASRPPCRTALDVSVRVVLRV